MKFVAKTLFGLEHLLDQEIKDLGGQNVEILNRAVSFEGDLECLYKVNLLSRTALRILTPLFEFSAHNETVLYKRIRRYDWTQLFGLDETFAIDSTAHSTIFNHSQYLSLKVKDAIVDLFRYKHNGRRPSIDIKAPDYRINVHCLENKFTIALDSSGESLHKRGYRGAGQTAPLNEVLAAGMLMLTGWGGDAPLYDPMCGSGTLLTEAFAIAQNIPPGINRDHYGFMNWADFDSILWAKIRLEAVDNKSKIETDIIGHDANERQIKETQKLLQSLGYAKYIKLAVQNFIDSDPPSEPGIIIMNPPYGERIYEGDITLLYQQIGDTLKQKYQGWEAWIISSNQQALKKIGLRPAKKYTLFNGALECKYQKFELYKGSRKQKKNL